MKFQQDYLFNMLTRTNSDDFLKFRRGNAKLNKTIATFALPAGRTCPCAEECFAYVQTSIDDGKIKRKLIDGPKAKFRCYAASLEVAYPNVYNNNKYNFDLLKCIRNSVTDMAELINRSLPKDIDIYRIHTSGDFFSPEYFQAWMSVAKINPMKKFYAYTKCIQTVLDNLNIIPDNFSITCSYGGKQDDLLEANQDKLKLVKIYFSPELAEKDGVQIDHDDSLAMDNSVRKFGLLLHGMQPKGSKASLAQKEMKAKGIKFSYSK